MVISPDVLIGFSRREFRNREAGGIQVPAASAVRGFSRREFRNREAA